jgi:cystathionine beta-synthase
MFILISFVIDLKSPLSQKGSILAQPESLNTADNGAQYIVEGIGYDFVPDVLSHTDVDVWLKTSDEESFSAVQMLMRSEGLLVGGSSGSALAGALRWLKSEEGRVVANTLGKNVVVLLPDGYVFLTIFHNIFIHPFFGKYSIRNYMSKPWFLNIAMEAPPSPLAGAITQILQSEPTKEVQRPGEMPAPAHG